MKTYTEYTMKNYVVNSAVKLIDIQGNVYYGWIVNNVDSGKGYTILPFNPHDTIWNIRRSYIKKIVHISNGYTVPKDMERLHK